MEYLIDRIKEPGTMRSLVWVLLSLAGMTEVEEISAQITLALSALLGIGSAAMPERKAAVSAPAQDIVDTVQAAVRAHVGAGKQ